MIEKKGGKAPAHLRVYGHADVIRTKLQSMTQSNSQKDSLLLAVHLFLPVTGLIANIYTGFPRDLLSWPWIHCL
jgi:hypothetical protein